MNEDGRPRGFAHVTFTELEGAAKALQLSGSDMDGREVYIDSAKERAAGGRSPGGALPFRITVPALCASRKITALAERRGTFARLTLCTWAGS